MGVRVCIAVGCTRTWDHDADPYPVAMVACSMEHLALGARAWLDALGSAEGVPAVVRLAVSDIGGPLS